MISAGEIRVLMYCVDDYAIQLNNLQFTYSELSITDGTLKCL